MTCREALDFIHSLGKFGSRPGLERITEMLKLLGSPQEKLKVIHVAGTNGKGSTSLYIANILHKSGKKVGLYTSPFVTEFNERISIDGNNISNDDLAKYTELTLEKAKHVFNAENPITEFEFITALAFKYFYDCNCDVVVLEVGLGGRLDATNVIESPLASVITKIDLDHTGILGDTIEKIAAEKCGIIKKNCPVITTISNEESVLSVIADFSRENCSELYLNDFDKVKIKNTNVFGNNFLFEGQEYYTKMPGIHQIDNALTAIKTVKTVFPEIEYAHIYEGLRKAQLPARCEVISKEPLVILDGSHNPNGTEALAKLLRASGINNATAIIGFMADKDVGDALQNLKSVFNKMITVRVQSNSRSMSAEELKTVCENICKDVVVADSYDNAINLCNDENIIVFGSLYLSGDIRPKLIDKYSKD